MESSTMRTASARAMDALRRVDALDGRGPRLGAVPVLNPGFLAEIRTDGALAGRVCTVKDSFAVTGLPLAAGSPAFEQLVGSQDATVVALLRAAGASILGKTNMPPVAIGGGQPGLYGRTRSPYNPDYLAAAWHSGSSIGSGVSVAAGYCDFGIGEETVSSGRSPASNNGLVAYTPSWGVVSSSGNVPLHPYRDVVVPHTTDMSSLALVLPVLVGEDQGDVWHRQGSVDMSHASRVIEQLRGRIEAPSLEGLRLGVPHLYVGESSGDVAGVPIRRSIKALWEATEQRLREAGADVVRVRLPLVEAYEGRTASLPGFEAQGFLPREWTAFELGPLMTHAWTRYLQEFAGGTELSRIDPRAIRPSAPWSTDIRGGSLGHPGRDAFDFARIVSDEPLSEGDVLRIAEPAVRGLDEGRRRLLDDWMDELGLDALIFPANGDIGPWSADHDLRAAKLAWRDGSVFSHGNHVFRRTGVPTVTLPMGIASDIGMPVGATIAGRGWGDARLIGIAAAVESVLPSPPAPPLPEVGAVPLRHAQEIRSDDSAPEILRGIRASGRRDGDHIDVAVETEVDGEPMRAELLGMTAHLDDRIRVTADDWPEHRRPLLLVSSVPSGAIGFCEVVLEHRDESEVDDVNHVTEEEGAA